MTTRNPTPPPTPPNPDHGDELPAHLPAHLAALSADLDRLAAMEAKLAGPSLEDRLFVRTRSAALHQGMTPEVRRMNDAMQADAARTLAEAPAGLEQRVFDHTVGIIRGERSVIGRIDGKRWLGRLALAASLALAVGGAWLLLNSNAQTPTPTPKPTGPIVKIETHKDSTVTPGSDGKPDAGVKVAANTTSEDLQTLLASTEAEEKFIALFALSSDSLSADIKSASLDAEQLSGSLFPEPIETPTVGG